MPYKTLLCEFFANFLAEFFEFFSFFAEFLTFLLKNPQFFLLNFRKNSRLREFSVKLNQRCSISCEKLILWGVDKTESEASIKPHKSDLSPKD